MACDQNRKTAKDQYEITPSVITINWMFVFIVELAEKALYIALNPFQLSFPANWCED